MSTRSKQRVQILGEVFTAEAEVQLMLDMIGPDASDPACVILEPSCGNGNFLVEILSRRAAAADPVSAASVVRGVDICPDNVAEARDRMRARLSDLFPEQMKDPSVREEVDALLLENVWVGDFLAETAERIACDVIIGNPPYQAMDGGHGASARPIYHHFVLAAKAAARRKVCLIIPARWYTGGKGLGAFRAAMLADRTLAHIVDWENSSICFPGVDISGGICAFLLDAAHDGDCVFENRGRAEPVRTMRDLRATEVLIRDACGAAIVQKALTGRVPLQSLVRPRNAFGMATNFRPLGSGEIGVLTNSGWVPHELGLITSRADLVGKWKVCVSGSAFEHAGAAGKDGKRRVLSRILILPPQTATTETYILIDAFDDQARADRLAAYLSTRTVRYLVSLAASSHHITRDRFRFVPIVPLTQAWTDEDLWGLFGLSESERTRITDVIRSWPEERVLPLIPTRGDQGSQSKS